MEEHEFVASAKESWGRLAASVSEARRRGVSRLGPETLREMHEDYRRAAADLAYAQTHFPGSGSERHLNRLVGQAHGELYGSAPRRLGGLWRFLSREYPVLLRENGRTLLLSACILFGAMAVGALLMQTDPDAARLFLPAQIREGLTESFAETQRSNESLAGLAPLMSAYIGVNNVQVALTAFAGGMTVGLLTVYALFTNGAMLGVLAAMFGQAGLALPFWALIVPHGALELPAIVIAGAAGLRLAGAILFAGDLPRSAALRAAAPVAVRLLLGTIPIFTIAALIEGFVTPRAIDPALKLGVGVLAGGLLAAYWSLAGRGRAPEPA